MDENLKFGTSPEQQPPQAEQEPQVFIPESRPPGQERQAELNVEQSQSDSSIVLPPVQLPADDQTAATAPVVDTPVTVIGDMPQVADDVDVIEMEWVNKAKKIIRETKDDPHAQEQAMEELQIEYLKRRYGKTIKKTRT